MQDILKPILEIQELDIKMIRLMRLKKKRLRELDQIESLRSELQEQLTIKQQEVTHFNEQAASLEEKIQINNAKLKLLESRQSSVKKVEEFNALTQEMTSTEREKISLEHQVLNLVDKRVSEEEILVKIRESLSSSEQNSKDLENDIRHSIEKINEEGHDLRKQRNDIVKDANQDTLKIYERLLKNKKDRVLVPIENRTCSGCHIALTAQHENLVRKGKSLVFCEHCSRIHYWQESEAVEGTTVATKRRRRKALVTTTT